MAADTHGMTHSTQPARVPGDPTSGPGAHPGASNDWYYHVLEGLPLIVYSVDATPPYAPRYISRGIEALGYSREEWLEVPDRWLRSIHPDDRERVVRAAQAAFEAGSFLEIEYRMVSRDGAFRWIHDRGEFVTDPDGTRVWRGVMLDVTPRKNAELALHDSQSEYRRMHDELNQALALLEATIESTTDGLLVVDGHGKIVRMNRRFLELWRIPESIVATRDDDAAIAYVLDQLADPEGFVTKVRELYARPDDESFDTLHFKDGRVYERTSRPLHVAGAITGRVWSFHDVTKRRALEDELRQSHKMEAIGQLAGGVAHDFNNILTVIRGHVELLLVDQQLPQAQRTSLTEVHGAADRAMALTRQLLAFSRKQVVQPMVLDLAKVTRELEPLLRRLIAEDVTISTDLRGECLVTADRAQLEQVLINLVVNARDAMPQGGAVSIATGSVDLSEPRRSRSGDAIEPGPYAVLEVRDRGVGISPEAMNRIFEPFFTTKPRGQGTGLGLATVYGIVKQAGGLIEVESTAGTGTLFRVLLPATADRRSVARDASPGVVLRGSATILVAEDEDAVRRLVERMLRSRGFSVLAAPSGLEAVALARENAEAIDMILTDVVMPGMGGARLVEELRQMGIEKPVVYMTGHTDDEIVRRGVSQAEAVLLHKPFTGAELIASVQKALR